MRVTHSYGAIVHNVEGRSKRKRDLAGLQSIASGFVFRAYASADVPYFFQEG
jgi:hypothetical protein